MCIVYNWSCNKPPLVLMVQLLSKILKAKTNQDSSDKLHHANEFSPTYRILFSQSEAIPGSRCYLTKPSLALDVI